jgi:hypothetical protein
MIRSFIICMVIVVMISGLTAQKEDHIWLFGSDVGDNLDISTISDTLQGATNFDFNFDPPKVLYDSTRIWDIRTTNASICDESGQLLLYTNGQVLYNGNHDIVEDTINNNAQWDNWNINIGGIVINDGLPTIQGAIILPLPDSEDLFYIVYSSYTLEISRTLNMKYAIVQKEQSEYTLLERDIVLFESDTLSTGNLNAVKHGNGRDWWLIFSNRNHSCFHKYLLNPTGFAFHDEQCLGDDFDSVTGQLYFSNDGTKLGMCSLDKFGTDGAGIYIADFDRNTGLISNVVQDNIVGTSFSQGVSFSPNGRFLYATDSWRIYQYDMESEDIIESRETVAIDDGYIYYYPTDLDSVTALVSQFGWMALAPDGKIYISTITGSSRRFHRINNPNWKGEACDVDQHSIVIPTSIGRGVPNFPNFRLGPLDDSPADTLGLNNHPVAKFRYVQDTLEDLRVHFFDLSYYDPEDYLWDFGDGNTSDELEPNHAYAEKGVYEVCLTVSNIYDTSTSCKTIMLGTTSTIDKELAVDVSIYPNPTSDYLTINFHNYIALDGMVRFYDVSGREVKSVVLERASTILDLQNLPSGAYLYKVYDEGDELYTGQVVVVK